MAKKVVRAVKGKAVKGKAVKGRAIKGKAAKGKAAKGKAAKGKAAKDPSVKRSPALLKKPQQVAAIKKTRTYIDRLGVRKAAKRLETTSADVQKWLKVGFPKEKLSLALGLGKPGGLFVYIRATNLKKAIETKGARTIAALTGMTGKELKALAKDKPRLRVRFDRKRLAAVAKQKGVDKLAQILDVKRASITDALRVPQTKVMARLAAFTKRQTPAKAAAILGISEKQLQTWLKKGVPSVWEVDVDTLIGKRSTDLIDQKKLRPRSPAQIKKAIASAKKIAEKWNKKAPPKHRLRMADVERWARVGMFAARFASIKDAIAITTKPIKKPPRKRPPPPKPAERPIIPEGAGAPKPAVVPALPPPPSTPPLPPPIPRGGDPLVDIPRMMIEKFLGSREKAFQDGRYPIPIAPWNKVTPQVGLHRYGVILYRKVHDFVHRLDLMKVRNQIIETAKKILKNPPDGPDMLMTIRFTVSVLGSGNPFYPDAFVEGDHVNFKTINVGIRRDSDITDLVDGFIYDLYNTDDLVTMLFFEYYEFIKTFPKAQLTS